MSGRHEACEKRIDTVLERKAGPGKPETLEKKRMFGGVCYLLHGNMCFGIHQEFLVVRVGEKTAAEHSGHPHIRPFEVTGRPMKGWMMLDEALWNDDHHLERWLGLARDFARSLPPKAPGKPARRGR